MRDKAPATALAPEASMEIGLENPKAPRAHWLFMFLARNWKRLGLATAFGFLLFALIAFLIPPRYTAVARLMPPDQSGGNGTLMTALLASGGDLLASLGGGALGLHTSGATVVGILTSRTVQDDIINSFDLRSVYGTKRYEDTRRILQGRSAVSEDKKSGIITIAVEDRNPERSAKLAQAYIEDLNRLVAKLTTSSAHRERVFLEERIGTVKQQLDDATLRLGQFSSKNKTLDPQLQGRAMLDAASALQGQLIAAETELSGLKQIYGSENYRVKASEAKVGELRGKLRTFSGSTHPDASQGSDGQLYPSLEQLPLLGNTYYELARQAKIEEALYETLVKQYELAKVEEAKELPSIKVLDEPVIPEKRSFPPRALIIVGGAILVLFCAALWFLAKGCWAGLDDDDPVKVSVRVLRTSFSRTATTRTNGIGNL